MPLEVIDVKLQVEQVGETITVPASNGTRSGYLVEPGCNAILIEPVAAMRLQLVPRILRVIFHDDSAGTYTDILQDSPRFLNRRLAGNTGQLSAMTAADSLYIGFAGPIGGLLVDMLAGSVNAVGATLAAAYSRGGSGALTTLTVGSDGTASGGATLAQDGLVVFTAPTDWGQATLQRFTGLPSAPVTDAMCWLRLRVSATLSTVVVISRLTPIAVTAAGADDVAALTGGLWLKATTEYSFGIASEVGSIEIIAQAAAATTARISWIRR